MLNSSFVRTIRPKAVWGPKRTIAGVALALIGLTSNAIAAAPDHAVRNAQVGRPNSNAKPYKLDHELTARADKSADRTTRIIVELLPGAKLPPQFAAYTKRNGRL